MFNNQFYEVAAILSVAVTLGAIGRLLRQPLIVTFIAVGVLVGPAWLGISGIGDPIELLARMGIAILLFLVGIRLDVHVIRSMGAVALATGLGQVLFTSTIGFVICLGLGLTVIPAVYVAVALTFSSTIIIVKLLSDKREIDALHGRIAIGFLIIQDIVVVLVMISLSALGESQGGERPWLNFFWIIAKGTLLLVGLALLMRYVLPKIVHWMAHAQELLILFAIAWAMALAALGDWLGFSKEVGAFLAGVSLASTPFRESIGNRLVSLRDFLLLFFFIELGAGIDLSTVGAQLFPATVLSLFVLVGNPLIVMAIMGWMGYRRRTGFLAGLTVAQISEFSLILGALGVSMGHIPPEAMGLITLVGLITIGLSTYLILYSHPIYEFIAPLLAPLERKVAFREANDEPTSKSCEFVILGLGRYGNSLASSLRDIGIEIMGVDFDPQTIARWNLNGHTAQYGDADDPELATFLMLTQTQWVVCTIPHKRTCLALLQALRGQGFQGRIALTSHNQTDSDLFYREGADLVLMPFVDAARKAAESLGSLR